MYTRTTPVGVPEFDSTVTSAALSSPRSWAHPQCERGLRVDLARVVARLVGVVVVVVMLAVSFGWIAALATTGALPWDTRPGCVIWAWAAAPPTSVSATIAPTMVFLYNMMCLP